MNSVWSNDCQSPPFNNEGDGHTPGECQSDTNKNCDSVDPCHICFGLAGTTFV